MRFLPLPGVSAPGGTLLTRTKEGALLVGARHTR